MDNEKLSPDNDKLSPDNDKLPSAWRGLWVTGRLALKADPRLALISFLMVPAAWVSGSIVALWVKLLADSAVDQRAVGAWAAAVGLTATITFGTLAQSIGQRAMYNFQDKAGLVLETKLSEVSATVSGIEHHERPEYLDRLEVVRQETWFLHWMFEALSHTTGAVVQTLVTISLLASVHPLLLMLPVFGVPSLVFGLAARKREQRAVESAAEPGRLAAHMLDLISNASSAKEIRVFGLREEILRRRLDAWWEQQMIRLKARWWSANVTLIGSCFNAIGFAAAVIFVTLRGASGRVSVGQVLLTVMLAATLNRNVAMVVEMFSWVTSLLNTSKRFVWLLDHAERSKWKGRQEAPVRLDKGIEIRDVSFSYPGTDRQALKGLSLSLKPGSVLAVVGENGAGKTSLVKLLCGFYLPDSGRITVEGVDLGDLDLEAWRSRVAAAFQDFCRFEFIAREAVGTGDLPRINDSTAALDALNRAGGSEVVTRLPKGLETQLGVTWPSGVDLSVGEWQKLALGRAFMRNGPLLLILDEPTSSLDAFTEHQIFDRYSEAARSFGKLTGTITILVSHRFSTVRSADLIAVIDDGRVAELGNHAELMSLGGIYNELFSIQTRAYRKSFER